MSKFILTALFAFSTLAFAAETPNTMQMPPEVAKRIQPSDNHKILNDMAGTWDYKAKFWMDPKGKPEEGTGTSESTLILGGRYLQQDIKGTAMGQPFTGRGTMGFDNVREEYQSTWVDDMSTGQMISTGKYNPKTKTLEYTGTAADPFTGNKNQWYRTTVKMTSKNEHFMEMFTKGADGKEFKTMEMKYKRK
jgi:Protein of unknown function (DUF1579)